MSSLRRPRVSLNSLGCKVNQYEMRLTAEELLRRGFEIVPFGSPADACLVNTCSVTNEADVKSRATLRRAARSGDDPLVIATGCYADVAPEAVGAVVGVAAVVPNREKPRLPELVEDLLRRSGRLLVDLEEPLPSVPEGLIGLDAGSLTRTRAVLKVQDGCNHFCSFCIIPFARGRLTSRPLADVLDEACRLAEQGYRELVLTGICIGDYGDERGFPDRQDGRDPLAAMLEELAAIPGLARLRLSSIDPADVTDDLIATLTRLPQACRHLHLSLQSGDDEVLRRMRRRYDAATFEYLVRRLREAIPGLALTADVIVGFPGETDRQFRDTVAVCERSAFSKIHVFPYSPRSGTRASAWADDVAAATKEARAHELMELSNRLGLAFVRSFVGETVHVLVENRQRDSELLTGLTDNYLRVQFDGLDDWRGQIIPVGITSAVSDTHGAQAFGVPTFRLGITDRSPERRTLDSRNPDHG
jgi:threonylcarbamoyladenosine tRNA methylthiotransferase MtaB